MKYIFILFYFISINSYATPTDCFNELTQREMTECSIKKLDLLEKKLDKKNSYILNIIENDKSFILSNKAWLNYRDAHCKSVANIYSGGSIYNFVLTECEIGKTKIRLKSLESDYQDTINIITKGAP